MNRRDSTIQSSLTRGLASNSKAVELALEVMGKLDDELLTGTSWTYLMRHEHALEDAVV